MSAEPGLTLKLGGQGYRERLLDLVPFIEVPGLKVPKSRFMFMLHDQRFFDRLMPFDADSGEVVPRKRMVQQGCYEPYQQKIRDLMKPIDGKPPAAVHLGCPEGGVEAEDSAEPDYWDWVCNRREYAEALTGDEAAGAFVRANPAFSEAKDASAPPPQWLSLTEATKSETDRMQDLVAAMRAGTCFQQRDFVDKAHPDKDRTLDPPTRLLIPSFEAGRADCLEYLFLAGFNQNIIDFMNQDTSEVLDSIDPIYPDSSEQTDERFFVRYANHRAMITYVPQSRSLEIGNDYIGACPYAFLIHTMAMHNEFLAREHERKTMARIERIEKLVKGWVPPNEDKSPDAFRTLSENMQALLRREKLDADDPLGQAESAINEAKLAEFTQYDRFRYANPFRYDTERDVFETLEELRGVSRKREALVLAIRSLEDHATDLSRRQQKEADDEIARRSSLLNGLLAMTGIFGAGQMFYWIGEKAAGSQDGDPTLVARVFGLDGTGDAPRSLFGVLPARSWIGNGILAFTEVLMVVALLIFLAIGFVVLKNWVSSPRFQQFIRDGVKNAPQPISWILKCLQPRKVRTLDKPADPEKSLD